jgi:hypothetical protein
MLISRRRCRSFRPRLENVRWISLKCALTSGWKSRLGEDLSPGVAHREGQTHRRGRLHPGARTARVPGTPAPVLPLQISSAIVLLRLAALCHTGYTELDFGLVPAAAAGHRNIAHSAALAFANALQE